MESFQNQMLEFHNLLKKGAIQTAYRGLLEFMSRLRNRFSTRHPDLLVPGSLYQGFMDMTYFSIVTEPLKERDLKFAVVFLYDAFRFEIWLSAKNKQVLSACWEAIHKSGWDKYKLVKPVAGVDSVLEYVLVDQPHFLDLEALSQQIEEGALGFIRDVEAFLAKNELNR